MNCGTNISHEGYWITRGNVFEPARTWNIRLIRRLKVGAQRLSFGYCTNALSPVDDELRFRLISDFGRTDDACSKRTIVEVRYV